MFRASAVPIIRSYQLYTWQLVYTVEPIAFSEIVHGFVVLTLVYFIIIYYSILTQCKLTL
jgi:hypothetical protein